MLDRAAIMQSALRLKVGGVGIFGRQETTKVAPRSVNSNVCLPTVDSLPHPQQAARTISAGGTPVLHIGGVGNVAKVAEAVVSSDSVDVVNFVFWMNPHHMEPCEAMHQAVPVINHADHVSGRVRFPNDLPNSGALTDLDSTCENPGLGIIVKKFAQTLRGKIRISHEALQLLIGQRPRRVSARPGLRYFSGLVA